MKKILMVMLALSVIAFASCSNEDNVSGLATNDVTEVTDSAMQQVQRNMEFLKLQHSIQNYNVEILNFQKDSKTRGLGKFFRKLFKIVATVAADAVGGVLGGIPGGLTASGIVGGACLFDVTNVAVVPMPTRAMDIPFSRPDSLFYDESVVFNNVVPMFRKNVNDSIGYYHNKVLYNMFSDPVQAESFVKMDRTQQAQLLVSKMAEEPYLNTYYGGDLTDEVKINKGIATADAVIKIAEEVETEDELFARLAEVGLTDENVIAVMKEIIHGLSNIDPTADDGVYYQKVLEIIDASNLDSTTKLQLSDGVIIGQASNHLWRAPIQPVNDNLTTINDGLQDPGLYE